MLNPYSQTTHIEYFSPRHALCINKRQYLTHQYLQVSHIQERGRMIIWHIELGFVELTKGG